ncbi:alpha/beta-hydrolase [Mycena albidolilacea]|uniref:Alpha/beta-hydrolase n=1 Tax=Mycena albidolilacea TaxID=1033008 RepID=A0AAD6ZHJ5_9AGAR|nr:alpha/beta-hydrolase [Mycena albidolilacea]
MYWILVAWFTFVLWLSARAEHVRADRHTFTSVAVPDSGLTYVKNSGICETTPGVGQMSGYINVTENASIWFWFFEARSSPETAPLTLWLNGGPGCSAMIGLFQENGPCTVNPDRRTTTLNPYSWNTISNMIYIDQPVGAGFSTGTGPVDSTDDAAKMMWTAFQILFESPEFSAFAGRDLIFATESYGAHFGPTFITYFNAQNALIESGDLAGQKIVFTSLMINDGKHDPLIQYASYISFAADAPGYGPLQSESVIGAMSDAFYKEAGCRAQLEDCYAAGTKRASDNALCAAANDLCNQDIFHPAIRGYDSSDLRQMSNSTSPFPPTYYISFLNLDSVRAAIGATSEYDQCSNAVQAGFDFMGEFGRSALPPLAALADAHFPILIWVGDADIKANWLGVHEAMVSMSWYGNLTLNNTALTNWTIDGTPVASIKTVDSFTFSRVFGGGHNLPAFVPGTALQFFSRVTGRAIPSSAASAACASCAPFASSAPSPAPSAPAATSATASSARSIPRPWAWALLWIFFAVI